MRRRKKQKKKKVDVFNSISVYLFVVYTHARRSECQYLGGPCVRRGFSHAGIYYYIYIAVLCVNDYNVCVFENIRFGKKEKKNTHTDKRPAVIRLWCDVRKRTGI